MADITSNLVEPMCAQLATPVSGDTDASVVAA
jgi:hypothetical protein